MSEEHEINLKFIKNKVLILQLLCSFRHYSTRHQVHFGVGNALDCKKPLEMVSPSQNFHNPQLQSNLKEVHKRPRDREMFHSMYINVFN